MYMYVNKVDAAANVDRDEIMLSFKQIYPIFKEDTSNKDEANKITVTPVQEEVATLIMTKDFAETLINLLQGLV